MWQEWTLAILHVSAFLALVVFLSGQIRLCRPQWWNEAVLQRLKRLNMLYWGSVLAVILSGLARAAFGVKGWTFYAEQPIFWFKLCSFIALSLMSLRVNAAYRRWSANAFMDAQGIDALRRWMMVQAHIMMLFPLLGLMLAYGLGVK